jgi:iron complex outermembrane receptor protein
MSKSFSLALLSAVSFSSAALAQAPQASELIVTGRAGDVSAKPLGQTLTGVDRAAFENAPAFQIGDIIATQPGVTYAYGNGPRDISISVRGSNARNTFGVRNVQVLEDGFPMTQPDGLARTDLVDPHAYAAIDVAHGPASALFGNYATGGAILFRTRTGRELSGGELSADGGSHGYSNFFAAFGAGGEGRDFATFRSYVRGSGFTQHNGYETYTLNSRAELAVTPNDRLTVKLIDNIMRADLSVRLSLTQFRLNPYQQGCADLAAAGCASVSLLANGVSGARVSQSADQAKLKRDDRRTIAGLRWEHDFGAATTLRTQGAYDNRSINQPTSATSAVGRFDSYNVSSELTHRGAGALWLFAAYSNAEDIASFAYNVAPGGAVGALSTVTGGVHRNTGLRARVEFAPRERWTAVLGVGGERTRLAAAQTAYAYPLAGGVTATRVAADRTMNNVAPEASLTFKPDARWTLHARVAGAFGTPQATNLFVTPAGVPGANTELRTQKMTGADVGAELALGAGFRASVTGFYEVFQDELVSQSAGANLLSYTFNAPRSAHRGVEAGLDWRPQAAPGAYISAAYLLNDQVYKRYSERLSAGAFSAQFDRAGNKIPGVSPQNANVRVGYDAKGGSLAGLGGYLEATWKDAAFLDNATLLKAPGQSLLGASLYYDLPKSPGAFTGARVFVTVQNLADRKYVSSASNIADSLSAANGAQNGAATLAAATGSIYAGQPRTLVGGLRVRF